MDELSRPVAGSCRLAESKHNICAACLTIESKRRVATPSIATFFRVLAEIEHQLGEQRKVVPIRSTGHDNS